MNNSSPASTEPPTLAHNPYSSKPYRYYVLGLFSITYMFNFVDRQILAILQEPIKQELALSDTQLGLMTGFTFAVFYIVMGIPIARWADRGNRRNILALCLALWSAMTALCGLAQNYIQLLLARMGVGVGEAGCSPPSHSMISDMFPIKERTTAFGVYNSGVNIGMLVGFLLGGWLQEFFGWRVALLAVGIPGVILAIIIKFTVREPTRPRLSSEAQSEDHPTFKETLSLLWSKKTYRYMVLGGAMSAFSAYCLFSWLPSFLIRSHGMSTGTIGTMLALSIGIGGAVGTMATGYFADRLGGERDKRWYPWILIITYGIPVPFLLTMFYADSGLTALFLFIVPACLLAGYLAPLITVTHSLVKVRMRALSSALSLLIINLIGLGLGPVSVGLLSDTLTPSMGDDGLRIALCILSVSSLFLAVFLFFMTSRHVRNEMPDQ